MAIAVSIKIEKLNESLMNKGLTFEKAVYYLFKEPPYRYILSFAFIYLLISLISGFEQSNNEFYIILACIVCVVTFLELRLNKAIDQYLVKKGFLTIERAKYSFDEDRITCLSDGNPFTETWENVAKLERTSNYITILTDNGQLITLPRVQVSRSGRFYDQLKTWFDASRPSPSA